VNRRIEIPAELNEPPVGTVVLDKDGQAWQRYSIKYETPTWGSHLTSPGTGRRGANCWFRAAR
jgi:hypothetical protein